MRKLGIVKLGLSSSFHEFLAKFCAYGARRVLCENVIHLITGFSPLRLNATEMMDLLLTYPDFMSVKQLLHYGQEISSGIFIESLLQMLEISNYINSLESILHQH